MPTAFNEPNKEKKEMIVARMPDTSTLDAVTLQEFDKAMNGVVGTIDTNIRSVTINRGNLGQNHYFAIRSLITPCTPPGYPSNTQLVGQQYFGINRYFSDLIDIADIEFWAIYEDGDWSLHTWSPGGEHFQTGNRGTGKLKTGFLKVNGNYLSPSETISFIQSLPRRRDNFPRKYDLRTLNYAISQMRVNQTVNPKRLQQMVDLGWMTPDQNHLTYVFMSMHSQNQAKDRKAYDEVIAKILDGDNVRDGIDLGPHGNTTEIKKWFHDNGIISNMKMIAKAGYKIFDDVRYIFQQSRVCQERFGFTLLDSPILKDFPSLYQYSTLSVPTVPNTPVYDPSQRQQNTQSAFDMLKKLLGR